MSFLSLAFLAALPLAAAPILLHLFDRRRNVVIDWGAMQFLVEAAARRTSARRLKQWLLLLLRVFAVAALVLAMARPMMPGSWFGNADRGETIFIIDNSMSMTRTPDDVSLFEQAIDRAVDDLGDVEAGDFVRVLTASPYPVWATAGSMRVDPGSRSVIEDRLRELRPTGGRSDLLSALFTAVQADVQPTQRRRRIVLLTDGQQAGWSLADEDAWKRFRDVLQSAEVPSRLDIVDLDRTAETAQNVAVDRIRSSRTVVGIDETCTLTAQLHNHGRTTSPASSVRWTIGEDERHASRVPSLEAGETQDVVWKHSFSEAGVYAISCRVAADDELAPDNRATVVVEAVDEIPVLLVESAPQLAELQRDAFFVQAALGWIDGEPLDERSVYVPTLIRPERLTRLDLTEYRAVVIPNLKDLGAEAAGRLEEFVKQGGGLWIALGPRTDAEAFNEFFFADGNGLAPLALDHIISEETTQAGSDGESKNTTIDPFVKDHPATTALTDNERLDLGDVAVSRRFRFVPPPEEEDVSVLLRLTDGEPLAVEKYLGRGRVIVQSIPLRLQWSELARSQAFVVMVQDWLGYLAQPRGTRYNLAPGDPLTLRLPDAEPQNAMLTTPRGDEIELTPEAAGDGVVFRSTRTMLPGDYSLEVGFSGEEIPFHVNRGSRESHLAPLTTDDRELLAELAGLSRNTAGAGLSATNRREPLWPLLLMILIGLMVGELLLSGMLARERFGSAPIRETAEYPETSAMAAETGNGAGQERPERETVEAGR